MLNLDEVLKSAREQTQLPDPDQDSWRTGLELLLQDHRKVDILNELGWQLLKANYIRALSARMKVDDYLRRHPDLATKPVRRPVFILGMPRTGTTVVSYLMGADPKVRSLLKWEAYDGVPPAAPGALKSDPRCLAEKAKDEMIIRANPKGVAQHFEAGDGPTECVHLLAQDFRSLMFAVMSSTPDYHDWLMNCDMTTAFTHRKRVFQVLQATNQGRWVLKMPSDALFVQALFQTFPDAKVIWTHRDPYVAFASSMSMRTHAREIFNRDADLPYMRDHFPTQLGLHLSRPLEMSAQRPRDFFHVYYDDLVTDPLGQMQDIYAWLGDPWTPEVQASMTAWLQDNPQGRFGTHTYSLEQWGIPRADLTPYFADYLQAHPKAVTGRL